MANLNMTVPGNDGDIITITIPATNEKASYTRAAGQITVKDTHIAHLLIAIKGSAKA